METIVLKTAPNGAEIEIIKDNILFLESKDGGLTTKIGIANYHGGSVEVYGKKEEILKAIDCSGFQFSIG